MHLLPLRLLAAYIACIAAIGAEDAARPAPDELISTPVYRTALEPDQAALTPRVLVRWLCAAVKLTAPAKARIETAERKATAMCADMQALNTAAAELNQKGQRANDPRVWEENGRQFKALRQQIVTKYGGTFPQPFPALETAIEAELDEDGLTTWRRAYLDRLRHVAATVTVSGADGAKVTGQLLARVEPKPDAYTCVISVGDRLERVVVAPGSEQVTTPAKPIPAP